MDIYKEVTDRIIAEMESGVIPWQKPWIASGRCVAHTTGKPYSLLNQMLLGCPGEYITFNQCQKEGGKVKKSEKSRMVVFWKWVEQEDEETGEKKEVPFLRYYNVFHINQCEGIAAKHTEELPDVIPVDLPETKAAEDVIYEYIGREGVQMIHEEGDRAYYQPATDKVILPYRKQFMATAEYFGTIFHELVHSTGHAKRLNRLATPAFFGSEAYSKEELVAEIGAAALVNITGLETAHSFRNNTAYVQNWLTILRNDKRFIVSAAGKAEKAVNLILGSAG